MKIAKGDVKSAQLLTQYLYRKYAGEGYVVRIGNEIDSYVLHICSDESGVKGTCASVTGLDKDIVVRIKPEARADGKYVSVNASGKYRGKVGRIGFGTFVAFGVVAITGLIGAANQADMAYNIENESEEFLKHYRFAALPCI